MNLSDSQKELQDASETLRFVCEKGVRVWSENGRLHYRSPKGALTEEDVKKLSASGPQISALLERATRAKSIAPSLITRSGGESAPLTFTQLAYWHLCQPQGRRVLRGVASATRLRGRLNIDTLRQSVAAIVCRHEALRTRIVVRDGVPRQEIDESGKCELRVDDLTNLPDGIRDIEAGHLIEQFLLEPIDVAVDQLFGVQLLRIRDDEHVLVVAMEHIISDGHSLVIVMRDLLTAYAQALKGHAVMLPEIPIQLADYAVWQRNTEESWIPEHGEYWKGRLNGCQQLRFPKNENLPTAMCSKPGLVPIQIGRDLIAELREWCRLRRTTLVMSIFTAYVGLVLRWCDVLEGVIRYQSDSRVSPQIENTIGYLASQLYLRVELRKDDSFLDLLNRVTEEYCTAYEHADFSYLQAQESSPEFTRNSFFNWVNQGSTIDLFKLNGSEDAITCSRFPFEHPIRKNLHFGNEPGIVLTEADNEIVGNVYFPSSRFSIDEMERFGRNFLRHIGELLRQPEQRVREIVLV